MCRWFAQWHAQSLSELWAYAVSSCLSRRSVDDVWDAQSVFRSRPSPRLLVCRTLAPTASGQVIGTAHPALSGSRPSGQCGRRLTHSPPNKEPMWKYVRYSRSYSKHTSTRSSSASFGLAPGFGVSLQDGLSALTKSLKVARRTPKRRLKCSGESFWAIL